MGDLSERVSNPLLQDAPNARTQLRVGRAALARARAARIAAEAESARVAEILEASTNSFVSLDRQWRFAYVNRAAERFLQHSREELLGRSMWDVFPGAVDSIFHREYHRAMRERVPVAFEAPSTQLPGTWFEVRAYPSPVGLSIHTHDITERKRAEEALHTAMRAREQLMRVVSHDLRNPLGAVFAHADLLRESLAAAGQERERRWAETIRVAAEQMNRLISDLVEVSALESGQLSLRREAVSPAHLIREAIELLGPLAAERGVQLRTEAGPKLPSVAADPERILQVLSNLIGNALAFTPPGGRVTVGATAGEGVVRFFVADSGAGIPEEEIPHVFQPYWRGRGSRHAGMGLGLTITKRLVDAHGGAVLCESRVGHGTTFHFTLPVAIAERVQPEVRVEAQGAHRG